MQQYIGCLETARRINWQRNPEENWSKEDKYKQRREPQHLHQRVTHRRKCVLFQSSDHTPGRDLPANLDGVLGNQIVSRRLLPVKKLAEFHVIKNVESNLLVTANLVVDRTANQIERTDSIVGTRKPESPKPRLRSEGKEHRK